LLQADPYQKDLDLLLEYARAAGEIARSKFKTDFDQWEKDGGAGPVTEADIAIDRMLRSELIGLAPTMVGCRKRPRMTRFAATTTFVSS